VCNQGLVLSPYLLSEIIDEVTKEIQDEVPWCMFADDIVLIGENL